MRAALLLLFALLALAGCRDQRQQLGQAARAQQQLAALFTAQPQAQRMRKDRNSHRSRQSSLPTAKC